MSHYRPITTFPAGIHAIFTDAHDGSISTRAGEEPDRSHIVNRVKLIKNNFHTDIYSKIAVTYGPEQTYTHVERLTDSSVMTDIACDALYTTLNDAVLMLPVADCVATIVYDPVAHMCGILHLGRHSSVAGLIETFAIEVADNAGSDPRDWYVWMSPSLKQESDRMTYFTPPHVNQWREYMSQGTDGMIHIDVTGHNRSRFERLGVAPQRMYISPINTYTDKRYFSQRASDELADTTRFGRMMAVATLRP